MPVNGSTSGGSGNSANSVRAGKAHVELSAKDKGVGAMLEKMRQRLLGFGKVTTMVGAGMAGVAAPVLGVLGKATSDFLDRGTQILQLANRFGTTTEAVSEMGYAFDKFGVDINGFADVTKDLQSKLSQSIKGGGVNETLAELGLNADQLMQMPLADQFETIADAVQKIQNPADRTRVMMELMGDTGSKLTGLFEQGSAGFRKYRDEAKLVGASMPREEAEQAAAASAALNSILSALKYSFQAIGAAILPSADEIKNFTTYVLDTIKAVRDWVKENKGTIKTIALVAGAVFGAGAALTGIGLVISIVATAAGGLVIAVKAVIAVLAAIISPIGLIVLGVAGLAAGILYLISQTEEGSAALGRLMVFLGELKATFLQTFQGITDALAAGEFKLALDIALKGALVVWRLFLVELQKAWNWFKGWFVEGWHSLGESIGDIMIDLNELIFSTFSECISWIIELVRKGAKAIGASGILEDLDVFDKMANDPAVWNKVREQLDKDRASARVKRQAARDEGLETAKKELGQAKDELNDLTKRAAMLRALRGMKIEESGPKKPTPDILRLADRVKGVFSAPNYKQVFNTGDTVAKRQLDELKEINVGVDAVKGGIDQLANQWKFA